MRLKCSLCNSRKIMLESGVYVCRTCDAPMPTKGKPKPDVPTWWQKIGIPDPEDPFKDV